MIFDKLSHDSYWPSAAAKAQGSWNLHMALPKGMDFFVLLSSASGLVGIRGQLGYNAGNSFEDAFARWRVSHGEKAVSLDLGALIDDGVLAETPDLLQRVLGYGIVDILTRTQFFAILDRVCNPTRPLGLPRDSQAVIGIKAGDGTGLIASTPRIGHSSAMCTTLLVRAGRGTTAGSHNSDVNYRQLIATATSLREATDRVINALINKLSVSL